MSEGTILETIYGKFSKYEILKKSGGVFSDPIFVIRKNGEYWKSSSAGMPCLNAGKKMNRNTETETQVTIGTRKQCQNRQQASGTMIFQRFHFRYLSRTRFYWYNNIINENKRNHH